VCSAHDQALPLRKRMRLLGLSIVGLLLSGSVPVACSAAGPTNLGSAGGNGGDSSTGGGAGGSAAAGSNTGGTFVTPTGGTGDVNEGGACAQAESQATLVKEPIDVIVVLDNSGSMDEELDSVERNINLNFAEILDASDVDYR